MTKQAPLPWTLTQNSWQYTTIYDAEGNAICRLDLEDWSVTEENQDELEKVQTQIAERIVKAVNEHADVKLVYIKRWRTLVKLPAKYADEIVEALRDPGPVGGPAT